MVYHDSGSIVTSLQFRQGLRLLKQWIRSFALAFWHFWNSNLFFFQTFRPISSGYSPTPKSPSSKSPITGAVPYNNGNSRPTYNNPAGLYSHNNGNGALPKQIAGLSLGSPHRWAISQLFTHAQEYSICLWITIRQSTLGKLGQFWLTVHR